MWSAVRAGDLGGFPMWTDVETRSKTAIARDGAKTRRLPNLLLSHAARHSIPDMAIMVVSDDFVFKDCQGNAVTRRQWKPQTRPWERNRDYSKVTVHLLEVKYTYDLRVHDMVEPALQQHEDLANMLRTAGKWGAVHVHPFIIGGAGIMRKDNHRITETLGLGEAARQSLRKDLSIHSIRRTSRILEIRRPYLTSPAKLEGTGAARRCRRRASSQEEWSSPHAQQEACRRRGGRRWAPARRIDCAEVNS